MPATPQQIGVPEAVPCLRGSTVAVTPQKTPQRRRARARGRRGTLKQLAGPTLVAVPIVAFTPRGDTAALVTSTPGASNTPSCTLGQKRFGERTQSLPQRCIVTICHVFCNVVRRAGARSNTCRVSTPNNQSLLPRAE